jgi:CubicO group peptidase (beta-lactamase class C family)
VELDYLDRQLTDLAASERFSGVVRLEAAGGLLFESAYGLASRAWEVPCSPRTRFDTASITKLFTAVATLQQIESRAFALDTGVVEYLGLSATALSPAITPYHLLTHTSGIGDDADEEAGERYEDLWIERPNYSATETEHFLGNFATKPPNFAPGGGCRYCNAGYVLLGLMVERAAQLPYRDYVTSRVFAPAGMDRSGFFRMDLSEADVAEGADPVVDEQGRVTGWHRNIYSYPPIGSPDGGAHVTAEDLARFHRALLAGRLLGPRPTAAMLTPKETYRPRGAGMHLMGFGFEFETDADGAVRTYWKEGINAGASGELSYYPAADLTVVVLSNMESGAWEPIRMIDRLVAAARLAAGNT